MRVRQVERFSRKSQGTNAVRLAKSGGTTLCQDLFKILKPGSRCAVHHRAGMGDDSGRETRRQNVAPPLPRSTDKGGWTFCPPVSAIEWNGRMQEIFYFNGFLTPLAYKTGTPEAIQLRPRARPVPGWNSLRSHAVGLITPGAFEVVGTQRADAESVAMAWFSAFRFHIFP